MLPKKAMQLLLAMLVTPLVALVDWQVLVWSAWWYLVWAGLPLAGAVILVRGRRGRSRSATGIGTTLLAAGVLGAALAWFLNMHQVRANQDLGQKVAAALDLHWAARRSYPKSLDELVPDFLDHLPAASVGALASVPWSYTPSEQAGGFALGYQATRGVALFYSRGTWSAVPVPW